MSDCLYHGYSGGPGRCPECERQIPELTIERINEIKYEAIFKREEASKNENSKMSNN